MTQNWDSNSGIRERLALLATVGPDLDESAWKYDSHKDVWYYQGGALKIQGHARVTVSEEGSASLARLASQGLDRQSAMNIIGYPERP